MLIDPITHEMIGCKQAQGVAILDGVQRSNPGVELLWRELSFEPIETLIPQRRPHPRGPPEGNVGENQERLGVYNGCLV